jgi:hypothetical protein
VLFAETVGEEGQGVWQIRELDGSRAPRSVAAHMLARPEATLRRVLINLHLVDKYALTGLLGSGGIALVALGFFHLRFRRAPARPEWVLGLAPLPLAGFLVYLVSARYFVSLVPALSIVAAVGLARFSRTPDVPSRGPCSGRSRLLLVLVLASFAPWIARPWFREDPNAVEKATGLWLRRSGGPGAIIMGAYPVIDHYAGSHGIAFHGPALAEAIARGRRAGARYLIADNYRLQEAPPGLALLASVGDSPPRLELVRIFEDRTGRRVLVYRIL